MTEKHALEFERSGTPEGDLGNIEGASQFATGHPARWSHGVEYCGPHETLHDGTNVAVRLHARALAEQGVPVLLTSPTGTAVVDGVARPVYEVGLDDEIELECGALRSTSIAERAVRIVHSVVADADSLNRLLLPYSLREAEQEWIDGLLRRTIAYTVWERDRVSPSIARVLNAVNEVWVPCQQNAQMLRSCGVERVRVVPHPFDPQGEMAKLTRRRPNGPTRRFYTVGQWQPRKGGVKLLQAFLRAFTPEDDVTLTIKTGGSVWPGYPDPFLALEQALDTNVARANGWTPAKAAQKIQIIDRRINASQIVKLHYENNIYVSAGHGEAWCIPAYDAVVAGNALVHVPYGGTADFAPAEAVAVPYELGPAPESYGWEEGAQWADYTVAALAEALKQAKVPEQFQRSEAFDNRFGIGRVGERMRLRVLGMVLDDERARAVFEKRHLVPIKGSVIDNPERPVVELEEPPAPAPAPRRRGRMERVWGALQRLVRR